jgi:23S rRNA pseudouridine2605 synthase
LHRGLHPGRWDELDEAQIRVLLEAAGCARHEPEPAPEEPAGKSRRPWLSSAPKPRETVNPWPAKPGKPGSQRGAASGPRRLLDPGRGKSGR